MIYSKIDRATKNDAQVYKEVKEKLKENFEQIMNIFTYEIGRSDQAVIGLMDFTAFMDRTKIKDPHNAPIVTVDLATLDRTFILTNVNTHGLINSAERNLNRYEFLEIIVRFANIKFKEKDKQAKTTAEAI